MNTNHRPSNLPARKLRLGLEMLEDRAMASVAFSSLSNLGGNLQLGPSQNQLLSGSGAPGKLTEVLDYVDVAFGPQNSPLGYASVGLPLFDQLQTDKPALTVKQPVGPIIPASLQQSTQLGAGSASSNTANPEWHPIGYRTFGEDLLHVHSSSHGKPTTPINSAQSTTTTSPSNTISTTITTTDPTTTTNPANTTTTATTDPTNTTTTATTDPTNTTTSTTTTSTTTSTSTNPTTTTTTNPTMGMGINVESPVDYGYPMFTDAMKQFRGFGSHGGGWANVGQQPLAADGYPVGDFGIVVATNAPVGAYAFQCTGNPTITFDGDQPGRSFTYDPATNLTTGTITIDRAGESFNMSFTQGSQRVTNIKIMRPGYSLNTTQMFTTDFLNKLKGYNTLRFMDWDQTNGNQQVQWSDRPAASSGWSYESQIELCKEANADGWFCVPAMADDNYITQMADLLKSQMGNHKVYIEYSNEIWNPMFSQTQWAFNQSQAAYQANPNDPKLWYGFQSTQYAAQWPWSIEQNWMAERTAHVSQLLHQEFAGDTRLHFVLAGQLANFSSTQNTLNWTKTFVGDPTTLYEDIAGAPYIQLSDSINNSATLTTDQVIAGEFDYFNTQVVPTMQRWGQMSQQWNIPLVSYEGAIDTVGTSSMQAKSDAFYDPRTRDLDLMLLTAAEQAGFKNFNYFHFSGEVSQYDADAVYVNNNPTAVTPNQLALQDFMAGQRMATPAANPWA